MLNFNDKTQIIPLKKFLVIFSTSYSLNKKEIFSARIPQFYRYLSVDYLLEIETEIFVGYSRQVFPIDPIFLLKVKNNYGGTCGYFHRADKSLCLRISKFRHHLVYKENCSIVKALAVKNSKQNYRSIFRILNLS